MTAVLEQRDPQGASQPRRSQPPALWSRALLAWVLMAVAMSLNGIFRVETLVPRWGEVWAGTASAISGIALIQLTARQAMQSEPPASRRQRAGIALLWLLATVVFELTFGHYVDAKPWSELLADYNLFAGHLWPLVLASLVIAPFLWGRQEITGRRS